MSKIAVYGASGHGKVVADIAKRNGYKDIIFIDDGDNEFMSFETFTQEFTHFLHIALGIGDNQTRSKIFEKVEKSEYEIVTLIDPSAIISPSVEIESGTVVMAGAIINCDVNIGQGVIINSAAVIEHDTKIDKYSHVCPNVSLAGEVKIGSFTHVGIGSCVIQNISIGDNVLVGAGSVVINNIENNSLVVGNPAHKIKSINE